MEQAQTSEETNSLLPEEVTEAPEETGAEEATPDTEEAGKDEGYRYAGKFSSIEDLEKGYKELTGKLREKTPPAPEEYDFSSFAEDEAFKEAPGILDGLSEDPLLEAALPVFKKHDLSQEAVSDIVKAVLQHDLQNYTDPKAEMAKLGDTADEQVMEIARWMNKFPEEKRAALMGMTTTADGIQALKFLKDQIGEKAIPDDAADPVQLDPDELWNEAQELKANTPNFEANTKAIKRYEALTTKAAELRLAQKK